ncbi:hypothetical protein PACILC2_09560 [Paenibacillus cisolokensis]|uniref:HEAT repeat domain-containing protein n=1 Tax=Paenibacillus cisolokensis TaxID=1658519 RepID=A0ABQ4N2P3_9BACL|nr:hypothetical protein [Paenibacillus cisolokensis]GIQ62388.1 hypothetical protein PACILC2_09560 [Paenibacillus cisolokensis]
MLDHYQIQLTRLLEAEQYGEAKALLRFLLQVRGEERRNYEEWENLLTWLNMAFPDSETSEEDDDGDEEEKLRQDALNPADHDEAYVRQVLYIMRHHPMMDQQILAIERAVHLRHEDVDREIIEWLEEEDVHPVVQFKALQCLRKRGAQGVLTLERLGETIQVEIGDVPLTMNDFPEPVLRVLERVEASVEADDPTLPHFARELWKESLQFLYGTSAYKRLLQDDDETVDCYAAALHLTLLLTVYGSADEEEVRDTYGITGELRFRYEQAYRSLRQITDFHSDESGPEP